MWIFKLVWNRSSNNWNFSDFPSKVGIVVVRDSGSFEILVILLLKLAELLFVANCWRAEKIWPTSIFTGTFSLWNCGWLGERAFFCFSWGKSRVAVGNFFLNCCYHVTVIANLSFSSCHHVTTLTNLSCSSCHHVTTLTNLSFSSCHHVTTLTNLSCSSCHHVTTLTNLSCSSCHHVTTLTNLSCSSCHHVTTLTNLSCSSCHHVTTLTNLSCSSCHHVTTLTNLSCSSCHHVTTLTNLSCSSCHHVTTVFWARVLCSLAAEDVCFTSRITLGVVLIRSLVFHVCVPECSRNGFEMHLYLMVQKKFV